MRVLIADDQALFRDSLATLLSAHDVEVVGCAKSGREAIDMAQRLRPDVALIDLMMPDVDGLEATRVITQRQPEVAVVILTGSEDDRDLFDAIRMGAKGYLIKSLDSDKFLNLLEGVMRGEPALSPQVAQKVLNEFSRKKNVDPDALTDRETEVLQLMTQGVTSNRRLAEQLGVSENTVKFHVRNILEKLHLNSRAQAVGYALRHRLVEPTADTA